MTDRNYSSFDGILRLHSALEAPDNEIVQIIVGHAALDIEMSALLDRQVTNPTLLKRGRHGFRQKASLIGALWKGPEAEALQVVDALLYFNDLRNAVAHPTERAGLEKAKANTVAACRKLDFPFTEDPTVMDLAISICAFMGGDPGAQKMQSLLDMLDTSLARLSEILKAP